MAGNTARGVKPGDRSLYYEFVTNFIIPQLAILLTSTFQPPSAAFFRNWMFNGHVEVSRIASCGIMKFATNNNYTANMMNIFTNILWVFRLKVYIVSVLYVQYQFVLYHYDTTCYLIMFKIYLSSHNMLKALYSYNSIKQFRVYDSVNSVSSYDVASQHKFTLLTSVTVV